MRPQDLATPLLALGLLLNSLSLPAQTAPLGDDDSQQGQPLDQQAQQPEPAGWAQQLAAGAELPAQALLAVEVLPFTPETGQGRSQAVKDAESRYLAYQLRDLLERSTQWGPVRMLEQASQGHELVISGEVLAATPVQLQLAIRVSDASGAVWIDHSYQQTVLPSAYNTGAEPFIKVFEAIASDLTKARNGKSLAQLEGLQTIASLRRAAWLAPDAFGDYLSLSDGVYQINRLPAESDPLFNRVSRIAEAQALFADAVDPNFGRFFNDMQPTYILWRKTLYESEQLMANYRNKSANRAASSKSARSIYRELQELKLYQKTVRETMESFVFRMQPVQIQTQGQLVELSGTLSEQSEKWQDVLSRLYEAEVGL